MIFKIDELANRQPLVDSTANSIFETVSKYHQSIARVGQTFNFYLGLDKREVNKHFLPYWNEANSIQPNLSLGDAVNGNIDFTRNVAQSLRKMLNDSYTTRLVLKQINSDENSIYLLYLSVIPRMKPDQTYHEEILEKTELNSEFLQKKRNSSTYTKTQVLIGNFSLWMP